ncbi:cullin homology [Tanacetum coccineum]
MELKRCLQSLACAAEEEKNVPRKEPISTDINEDDVFTVNEMFSSKCYKVKVGNGTVGVANMESEPKKQEMAQTVKERKQQIDALISNMAGSGTEAAHKEQDPGKLLMVQNLEVGRKP